MSEKVNREEFIRVLESVRSGLSAREIVEQSNCVVFQGGEVMTFNDEVFCRASTGLDESLTGAVPAEKLLEHLLKQPEESLTVASRDGNLRVKGAGRWADFVCQAEVLLPVDAVEKPQGWKPVPPQFCDAVRAAASCAGQDESVFCLTCIHLHPEWIEACDDTQICRWPMDTGMTSPAIVRASALAPVAALGPTKWAVGQGWIHFRSREHGLRVSLRRYDDEYPELDRFLGVEGDRIELPKSLGEECERAAVFSGEVKDNNRVLVELSPGKLKLKGRGVSGRFTAIKPLKGYKGRPFAFLIKPDLLKDLLQRHGKFMVTEDKLKVDAGGVYEYVACLGRPEELEEAGSAEVNGQQVENCGED